MRRLALLLSFAFLVTGCDDLLDLDDQVATCETEETLRPELEAALEGVVTQFDLVQLDGPALRGSLSQGEPVEIPLMDPEGEVVQFEASGVRETITSPDLTEVYAKGGQEVRSDPAVSHDIFRLDCATGSSSCGMVSFLDDQGVTFEAAVADDALGFTLIESASSLLTHLRGAPAQAEPGCHVVYNSDFHTALAFEEYPVAQQIHSDPVGPTGVSAGAVELDVTIPIALDSDHEFYDLNPTTVWRRQATIIAFMNLIYAWIEPVSSDDYRLLFEIESQESWIPDYGPTTTNKDSLIAEINDPDYYMINHPDNNEVSYFFVGYDMDGGIAGKAGGVCNLPGYDDTFGSSETHQDNHAWGQQVENLDDDFAFATTFGRIVVAAHEIGHMIGSIHSDGEASACAGGVFSSMCGVTLGLGGSGGDPDFRSPFFSDANDDNILTCVGDVY